jgi:hypothetical protein
MDRRHLLKAGGASLAMTAAAPLSLFDPRVARAKGEPFKVLSADEVRRSNPSRMHLFPARAKRVSPIMSIMSLRALRPGCCFASPSFADRWHRTITVHWPHSRRR